MATTITDPETFPYAVDRRRQIFDLTGYKGDQRVAFTRDDDANRVKRTENTWKNSMDRVDIVTTPPGHALPPIPQPL